MLSPEAIEQILTHGEDEKLEFKEALYLKPLEARAELIRDILSLVNSHGNRSAYLLIGITDSRELKDISHLGLKDENIQQSINELVDPPIQFRYFEQKVKGSCIGCIEIEPSSLRPHVVKKDLGGTLSAGDTFIRYGSSKRRPTAWDHQEFARDRHAKQQPKPRIEVSICPESQSAISQLGWKRATQSEAKLLQIAEMAYLPIIKELPVQFVVENIGGVKASDIRIEFKIPDSLTISSFAYGDPHSYSGADVVARKNEKIFYIMIPELMHHIPYRTQTLIKFIATIKDPVLLTYKIHEAMSPTPISGDMILSPA